MSDSPNADGPDAPHDAPHDAPQEVTHAQAQAVAAAAAPGVTAEEVSAAHAAPAPHGEVQESLKALHDRVSSLESHVGTILPLVQEATQALSEAVPSAAPLLERVKTLESFLGHLLSVLSQRFAGKLDLPAAPAPGP